MSRPRSHTNKQAYYRDETWPKGLMRKNGKYHWRRHHKGDRRTRSLGTNRLAQAIKEAIRLNEALETGRLSVYQAAKEGQMSLIEVMDHRIENGRTKRGPYTDGTKKKYRAIRDHVQRLGFAIIGRELRLDDISDNFLERYAENRLGEQCARNGHENGEKAYTKPRTIGGEVEFVRGCLSYAASKGWIGLLPELRYNVPGGHNIKGRPTVGRPLSDEEVQHLLHCARKFDLEAKPGRFAIPAMFENVIFTYLMTGMREGELRYLEWTDLDFEQMQIRLFAKRYTCKREIPITPKAMELFRPYLNTGTECILEHASDEMIKKIGDSLLLRKESTLRGIAVTDIDMQRSLLHVTETGTWRPKGIEDSIPMHPELAERLLKIRKQHSSNFVLPDYDGGYWRFKAAYQVQRIMKMAGISKIRPLHDLRTTCGTALRKAKVELATIQKLLRHYDFQETLIYAHYADEQGQEAIARLPSAWSAMGAG